MKNRFDSPSRNKALFFEAKLFLKWAALNVDVSVGTNHYMPTVNKACVVAQTYPDKYLVWNTLRRLQGVR